MCASVCVFVCVCRGQKSTLGVFLYCFPRFCFCLFVCLRHLLNLNLTGLAKTGASPVLLVLMCVLGI